MTRSRFDPGSTSLNLVDGMKSREPEAWSRFVHLYGPVVFEWCRGQYRLDEATAEEIGQRVLVKVSEAIRAFEHRSFRGWLRTITLNSVRDFKRREHERGKGGSDHHERLANVPAPEETPEQVASETMGIYLRAVDAIRDRYSENVWSAFWRMEIDGRTSSEIADELGITDSAVRHSHRRVLARLRTELKGMLRIDDGGPEPA